MIPLYRQYTITLALSPGTNATGEAIEQYWFAKLPEFNDATIHGPTPEKALSRAYLALAELVEAYTAESIPLPAIGGE